MLFVRLLLRFGAALVVVHASATLLHGSVPAVHAQHPPAIRGVVLDASTARPVSGARVEVTNGTLAVTTGADGRFRLRGLAPGPRTLRVAAVGYESRTVEVEARNGRTLRVRVEMDPRPLRLEGLAVDLPSLPNADAARTIEREEIEAAGGEDLAGVLDALPEVTVLDRGPGAGAVPTIRGSDPDEVLVLLDGMPLNSPLTGEVDLTSLPLSAVERIVVVPGARSSRFGPRAAAGVILVEGRRFGRAEASASSSVGSWGRWALEGSAGGASGSDDSTGWSGGLSARWRTSDGDFAHPVPEARGGGTDRRGNADASELQATAAVGAEGSSVTLRTRVHVERSERGIPGPATRPSPEARRDRTRLATHATLAAPSGTWELRVDGQRETARHRDPAPPVGPAYDRDDRLHSLGASGLGRTRAGPLRLELGAEWREDRIASSGLSREAPSGRRRAGLWTTGRWLHRTVGGWTVGATPELRADWSSVDDGVELSPRVGLSVFRSPLALRLSGGSAYAPPTLADQFFRDGVRVRPNPDLRAERVRNELQATVELRDGRLGPLAVDLRLTGFRSDVDGRILWLPDHRFVWRPENVDVTRRGWEAEAGIRWHEGGPRVTASTSRAVPRYRGAALDGPVAYRPARTARVSVTAPVGALRIRADARHIGERRTVPGSPVNALAPYWTADLSITGRVSFGGWRLEPGLRIENALDRPVEMIPDYPLPGRGWRLELRARPDVSSISGAGSAASADLPREERP